MWERRRGVGQMIGGGPESAIVKTTDGGKTWTKLTNGLPTRDIGRVALGVDPKAKPTRVYALGNGLQGDSGFFRSDDAGANFHRLGAPYGKPGTPEGAGQQQCDQPAGRRGGNAAAAAPAAATGRAAAPRAGAAAATPPAGANGGGAGGAQAAPPAGRAGGRGGCEPGAYC